MKALPASSMRFWEKWHDNGDVSWYNDPIVRSIREDFTLNINNYKPLTSEEIARIQHLMLEQGVMFETPGTSRMGPSMVEQLETSIEEYSALSDQEKQEKMKRNIEAMSKR